MNNQKFAHCNNCMHKSDYLLALCHRCNGSTSEYYPIPRNDVASLRLNQQQHKPPLGIKPRWVMLEHRNREIIEAMHRRADACMDNNKPITIDPEWIMELLENNKELLARCEP